MRRRRPTGPDPLLAAWCLFAPILAMFCTGEELYFGITIAFLAFLLATA